MSAWSITLDGAPLTTNKARTMHHRQWGPTNARLRHEAATLARHHKLPRRLPAVTIDVLHERKDRRSMPDVAACAPAAKAAIDGLVDWGLIADDSPEFLRAVTFRVAVTGRHAMTLTIEPVAA